MLGCLIAALTYIPLFKALTHNVNPAIESYSASTPISVAATDCQMHIFPTPKTRYSDCDKAKDFLTKAGLSFTSLPAVEGQTVVTKIGSVELHRLRRGQVQGRAQERRTIPTSSTRPSSTGR